MKIYIDSEYKCHTEEAEGLTAVETPFFDGRCKEFIEGYRFVPADCEWTREDGEVFTGEMISAFKDYSELAMVQLDADNATIKDMEAALELLGVTPTEDEA
ncbi:MAG: hypothetical protein IKK29_06575 [Christensenellaceae bacterium]|nr:hypothetical protein [Christensenellaceae bacterium]